MDPEDRPKNYLPRKYSVSYALSYPTQIPLPRITNSSRNASTGVWTCTWPLGSEADLKGRRVCCELGEGADARVDREMLEEVDSERPS
jgi:hypothetical protein